MTSFLQFIAKKPIGIAALTALLLLYFLAIFAPFFAPYEKQSQKLSEAYHPPSTLFWKDGTLHATLCKKANLGNATYACSREDSVALKFFAKGYPYTLLGFIPMKHHLFLPDTDNPENKRIYLLGADGLGRDVFSRLLYGAQISLSIGLVGITITMTMGFLIGGLAGYFGGRVDFFSMRLVELLMAMPGFYLLLALRSALADRFKPDHMYLVIIIILAFIGWSGAARVIRGMSLSIRNRTFVLAAESMGQSTFKILKKHILPNILSYLVVAATLSIPAYILGEAALSFLGLGIQEPGASWGLMLRQSQEMQVFMLNFWWMFSPGIALFITVIAFNILGDTLRDYIDPKMKV